MTHIHPRQDRSILVDAATDAGWAKTSWGEQARTRIRSADTLGRLAVIDYRAPAGFGPPHHMHRDDDEIFLMRSGTIVVSMSGRSWTAGPGDVVLLPRAVPHSWRAYGDDPVHIQVIAAPGTLETFFEHIAAQGLTELFQLISYFLNVGRRMHAQDLGRLGY